MTRKFVIALLLMLSVQAGVVAQPKKAGSMKRVGKVLTYPVAHPLKTVKGVLYGVLNGLGTFVDGAEYVTAEIAAGAAKLDSAVDSLEGQTNPAPKGAASGKQRTDNPAPK
jgi:hypothetical protein